MKPLPNPSRDRAEAAVLESPELLRLQQLECPAEPLDSLARTVVATAYGEGIDYIVTEMEPARACAVTLKVWRECARALGQQLPSERAISDLIAASQRLATLTFDAAAAAKHLDTLCKAAQQDPRMLGEARLRFESAIEAMLELSVEVPPLLRAIKAGLELRPEPEGDAPSTFHAHEVS